MRGSIHPGSLTKPSERKHPNVAMLVGILAILAIVLIGAVPWKYRLGPSAVSPSASNRRSSTYQATANDQQELPVLEGESATLGLSTLGPQVHQTEQPFMISGGFYSGQPVGARITTCIAPVGGFPSAIDKLDERFLATGWLRKEWPGYTIDTLRSLASMHQSLSAFTLDYTKALSIGTAYGTIDFGACGGAESTPYANKDVSVDLRFIR